MIDHLHRALLARVMKLKVRQLRVEVTRAVGRQQGLEQERNCKHE